MSTPASQPRLRPSRAAERAVERVRLTVVPRGPIQPPRVPFVVLVSAILVAGVAGLLCFNTSMQQRSFTITDMSGRADALAAEQQTLQLEIDRLRAPQHVAERAVHMGMVPAPAPAFIRLSDGTVLGRATPAGTDIAMPVLPPAPAKPRRLDPREKVQYVDPEGHVVPRSQITQAELRHSGSASGE